MVNLLHLVLAADVQEINSVKTIVKVKKYDYALKSVKEWRLR